MKLLLLFALFSIFSTALTQNAIAVLQKTETANRTITGTVTFTPVTRGGIDITVSLSGAVPRKTYSLEIHTLGDLNSKDGHSTGPLFRFDYQYAGCYPDPTRYEGALGNVTAKADGRIEAIIYSELLSLSPIMPGYVIGRSVNLVDMASVCQASRPPTLAPTTAPPSSNTTNSTTTNSTTTYLPTYILSQGAIGWSNDGGVAFTNDVTETVNDNTQLVCRFTQTDEDEDLEINGIVYFQPKPNSTATYVYVFLEGLLPNEPYSMHIHQYGDITGQFAVGPHFNPDRVSHGCLDSPVHHAGDLANMVSDQYGIIKTVYTITNVSLLPTSARSILGRALILNDGEDDCAQNLNDYYRTAMCVIGRSEYVTFTLPGPSQLSSSLPIISHISLFIIFIITFVFFN